MRHAEQLADRIIKLGGTPIAGSRSGWHIDPDGLQSTFADDMQLESDTVALYTDFGKLCNEYHNDSDTMMLFAQIIAEEQEHHTWFEFISMKPSER